MSAGSPTVVLYTTESCSLCEEARALLDQMGVAYRLAQDPRYRERVPVLEVDGEVVAELRFSARVVKRALRRARRASR